MNGHLPSKRPIAIDLFSGGGGMSLGLEASGFDIAAAVEIDAIHCLVHHFNFPYTATICQDISQVLGQDILNKINYESKEIDLVAGGSPCQGFSLIGKRHLADPRNRLVFEYWRIIKEIQPKYFIFENVPGIATSKHEKFLEELITEFAQINYCVVTPIQILDASDYGVPQKRKRLIMMGYRQDMIAPKYPYPTHSQPDNFSGITVGDVLADLAAIPVFLGKDEGIDANILDYSGLRNSYNIKPQGEFNLCHYRNYHGKVWGHLGSQHQQKSQERFALTIPGKTEKVSRFHKLNPEGKCNTLRAGTARNRGAHTAPRPIHYYQPRCISIREAARLHSFPDWFQFHRTIWHGFREIGNAVPPLVAKSLGEEIMNSLGINVSELVTTNLNPVSEEILSYNLSQASNFWGVPDDLIPKRKRKNNLDQAE